MTDLYYSVLNSAEGLVLLEVCTLRRVDWESSVVFGRHKWLGMARLKRRSSVR